MHRKLEAPYSGQTQRSMFVTRLKKSSPTLTLQIFSCAAPFPSPHPQKDQPLSDFWAALADAKEEKKGSATFLKLERGVKFPHEGGVVDRVLIRNCYVHLAKQATDYCEQMVDTRYATGIKREPINAPVFILRGNPGEIPVLASNRQPSWHQDLGFANNSAASLLYA